MCYFCFEIRYFPKYRLSNFYQCVRKQFVLVLFLLYIQFILQCCLFLKKSLQLYSCRLKLFYSISCHFIDNYHYITFFRCTRITQKNRHKTNSGLLINDDDIVLPQYLSLNKWKSMFSHSVYQITQLILTNK